jgi:hypothetical protein
MVTKSRDLTQPLLLERSRLKSSGGPVLPELYKTLTSNKSIKYNSHSELDSESKALQQILISILLNVRKNN